MLNLEKLKQIKAFVFDVDGVCTDGTILCDLQGELYRSFDSKDGFALRMAQMADFKLAVITGGRSESIRQRFITCGVDKDDVYLSSRDKMVDFNSFCNRYQLKYQEVMYFGDDVPDIELLLRCGVGVCPFDAVEQVKEIADYISPLKGGKGCLRQVIEMTMREQGKWIFDTGKYKERF